ncbi:transmembrane protein, putative [Leishmania tarentolae]|uniref:Transmembrane protein, putative n=1 Tax=Leishmania tarentolae TaxID=5689 RepID=A0A640KF58_LEITA|nr:transmembrane protein, putative [Leishmania tarentolae]
MASLWKTVRLLVTVLALLCSISVDAVSQSYVLERRVGSDGEWAGIGAFSISRLSSQAPARISTQLPGEVSLSMDERNKLASADLVYYRAYPNQEGKPVPKHPTTVVVTPCSLIRGFEAMDSKTVVLHENINIAPGANTSLMGLQVSSETNFFHSKMLAGDECDHSVVQKLFPTVRLNTKVGLVHPLKVARKVRYEDLNAMKEAEDAKKTKGRPPTEKRMVRNAEGEVVEEEVPVDERSFLQKYWMYIVIPIVMSVLQNMKG